MKRQKKFCEKCGLELGFRKRDNGKWEPCNPDGTDHWDVCRDVRYAKAKQGDYVETRQMRGYEGAWKKPGNKDFLVVRSSGVAKGKSNVLPTCDCPTPPWEDCVHTLT